MRRLFFALVLVIVAACWTNAEALSATCLPGGFPSAPTPPVFSVNAANSSNEFHIEVWRVPCQDGSGTTAVMLRATPIDPDPHVCWLSFAILQGEQFGATIRQPSGAQFCGDLIVPTTFSLEKSSASPPAFDPTGAFTLVHSFVGTATLSVPAGSASPQFGVAIAITGCSPCRIGQPAELKLHFTNPGPAQTVEVKGGVHMPGGGTLSFIAVNEAVVVPPGESELPIFNTPIPGGIPLGAYTLEAALLDPTFGVTLSRTTLAVQLAP